MLKYELKKLFLKQFSFLFIFIIIGAEIINFSHGYSEHRFDSEADKSIYYSYMEILQGKFDEQKEHFILSEQEKILNAQIDLKNLQSRLYLGDFTDKSEYMSEFTNVQGRLSKKAAFETVYAQYQYVKGNPVNRYFIPLKNAGICKDEQDYIFLLFVIASAAQFFLGEETSKMIILIRAYKNRKNRIFGAKIASIFLMITFTHILVPLTEYNFLIGTFGSVVINYPVQSFEYFGGCQYNVTILQAFIFICIIKLVGYLFIAALTVLIALLSKKTLFTVSFPTAVCILQQFAFVNSNKGYYLPTGLLSVVGYLRGDAYETVVDYAQTQIVKVFSAVSLSILFIQLFITVITLIVTACIGNSYYNGKKVIKKYAAKAVVLPFILVFLTGCNDSSETDATVESVYYNLQTSPVVSQNEQYFFHQSYNISGCGVTATNLTENKSFQVIRDPFDSSYWIGPFCTLENSLYVLRRIGFKDFSLYRIYLDDFEYEVIAKQEMAGHSAFLGLKEKDGIIIDKGVSDFFTNGKDAFFVTEEREVYKTDMDFRKIECVISDGIYNKNLVYNGKKIYYVNSLAELVDLDVKTGKRNIISDNFVTALELDKDKIIYSDKGGIFDLNTVTDEKEQITDITVDALRADVDTIVYSLDEKLYLMKNGKTFMLYDEPFISFGLIKGENKLIYSKYIYETGSIEDMYIDMKEYE